MAKRSGKKDTDPGSLDESSGKKSGKKLLEEIIKESMNPDCNLILLDGKIRELEKSEKNYIPLLMKRITQIKSTEQKVIFDLLIRNKSKEVIKSVRRLIEEETVTIGIRRRALMQLKKWGEEIDEDLLKVLDKGEKTLYRFEKQGAIDGALGKDLDPIVIQEFSQLTQGIKTSIIEQLLDDKPESVALVLKLMQGAHDLDENIIHMLASRGTIEVGHFFSNVFVETTDKKLRRLLKKHLFQMKNKGLEVVIPEIEDKGGPAFQKVEGPQVNAYVTGIDYLGERLVFLSKPIPGFKVVFFQIALSDQEGIKNFFALNLNRKEIRDFIKRISQSEMIQLIDIRPDYCGFLIEEAYAINLKKKILPPKEYIDWKREIEALKGKISTPIIYDCFSKEGLHELNLAECRKKYESLVDLKAFENWLIEPRLLWDYATRFSQKEKSLLVLSPYQQEERKELIITEAVGNIFNTAYRHSFKRRLEETAYFLFRTNEEESAKVVFSAALDLGEEGIPSEEHGFLKALVQKSLVSYAIEIEKGQSGNNIVVPR